MFIIFFQISQFLVTLEEDLKGIYSVDSVVDQCMYFGLSFGKVGCDFRLLLLPIFTERILDILKSAINKAVDAFEKNMENFTLINKNLPNIPWRNKDQDPFHPPDSLLEYYPLAEFLNNVLKAFNSFRTCAPISVTNQVVECLQNSLIFITKSILLLHSQEQQAFTSSSKDAFTRLCMTFSDDLIPYVQKCLHVIYPPNQIAAKLGTSVQYLQENHISFLDKGAIVEPIRHLLPPRIEPNFDVLKDEDVEENEGKGGVLRDVQN